MAELMYNWRHETTAIHPSPDGHRAQPLGSRTAFQRCLCPASLPNPARQCPRRTGTCDCAGGWLQRPDRAQCHPSVRDTRARRLLNPALQPPPPPTHQDRCDRRRETARSSPPQPTQLWQAHRCLDAGTGRRSELRPGHYLGAGERRSNPQGAQAAGSALAARQAVDYQPRPPVRPKKRARDRLRRWTEGQPRWVFGFEDETWWSRFARPRLHTWSEAGQPLRLVEQAVVADDPDPKALACYGLLRMDTQQVWLRFVRGRPVSGITTQFLGWCCERLAEEGKEALLLAWDNATWHISREVRAWVTAHNREVGRASC